MRNLLPRDGRVFYCGVLWPAAAADGCLSSLLEADFWRNDEVVMFGKRLTLSRRMAWFGEAAYGYAGALKQPAAWDPEVLRLKAQVEAASGCGFNCCLLNLYADGGEGMGWHADNESTLVTGATIASVSFGAERIFRFKHRTTGEQVEVLLEHGSLLLMEGETQSHWVHALPKSRRIHAPRINLTFRSMRTP
jgi:alkylated DNA repair dioxygenase AlkB